MKQVNRKFLQEQVRLALKEQEQEDKWGDTGGEVAADIILGLPFGSPSSYIQLKNYLSDIGMNGIGAQAAYKKSLEKLGNIEKAGARAPFSQLMLRFYKALPVSSSGDDGFSTADTLNLTPNEELAEELVDVKNYGYKKILPILKSKKLAGGESKVAKVEKFLRIMAHRNALSTLDESLEDIADSYGFKESDLSFAIKNPWGSEMKISPVTLFKDPDASEKYGLYTDFAKEIIDAGPGALSNSLEEFIMWHFNGLEDANFRKAMVRLMVRSNLPAVANAYRGYQVASQGTMEAVLSIADITLSTVTTVAFVAGAIGAPFTAGATAGAGIGAKLAAVTGMKALRSLIGKGAIKAGRNSKLVKAALSLTQGGGAAGKTIKTLESAIAQLSPLLLIGGQMLTDEYNERYSTMAAKTNDFLENYADKTEEERAAFFDSDIMDALEYTWKTQVKLMNASGFDSEHVKTRVADLESIRNAYITFNKPAILKIQKNFTDTTNQIQTGFYEMQEKNRELKAKLEKALGTLEDSNRKAEEAMNADKPKLAIARAFQQASAGSGQEQPEPEQPEPEPEQPEPEQPEPEQQEPEPEQPAPDEEAPKPNVSSSNLFFVGDSIAQGMRDNASGSDGVTHVGRTSAYVLDQLRKRFARNSTVSEAQEGKTAVISVGTNDAFNAGAGGNYTAEKTLGNIKEIVKILKQNGYQEVKVMPLFQDGKPGRTKINKYDFDQEKHRQFVNAFNSGLASSGLSTFDNNVELAGDGIHPKSYKNLLNRALSGASVTKLNEPVSVKKPSPSGTKKPRISGKAAQYWPLVKRLSKEENIDASLVMGIIYAESGFNPKAVSSVGAEGLMQLMPSVQKQFGVADVYDPEQNIRAGIKAFKIIRDKYIPFEMNRSKVAFSHESLSSEQKTRLGLYGFNWGARGIVSKLNMNKYDNIDDFFANVKAWYLTKHGYDYADKIFRYANANGASFSSISGAGSQQARKKPTQTTATAAAAKKVTNYSKTNTNNLKQLIQNIKDAPDLNAVASNFRDLTGLSIRRAYGVISNVERYARRLEQQNISNFVKDRTEYLKAIHSNNYSKWKSEYDRDIKAAGSDKDLINRAEKKIAWFHRPVFYATLNPSGSRKFFGNSPRISFAFEPGSSRVGTSYRGRETFYKEDTSNNMSYARFVGELDLFRQAISTVISKLDSLRSNVDDRDSEIIDKFKRYLEPMSTIASTVHSGLSSGDIEASRKAYLVSILDLALRAS